jgi:PAT family beta-lactamase induction signal transducer AmpG
MAATPVLADSSRVRYAVGAMMYFAQGIPRGLLSIAIPAWLATLGVSAGDIGSYLAVVILPWVFKLVTGPFMDRFMFLPMGRRKPWALCAQLGLTLSLLALVAISDPVEQLGRLMMIGMLINIFAATQDVAVDGMSIDLTPVREQGRLNAFMSFGKAAGWALTATVSGFLLEVFGMRITAIVASALAGVVFLLFIFVLEKEGERRLPWSRGEARSKWRADGSFRAVFGGINRVLWKRASLFVLVIMFFSGMVTGYGYALMPVAAVNVFGYTTAQWSGLVAVMGLIGAVVALSMGPAIDRFGSRPMLILNLSLVGVHAVLLAQTQLLWQDNLYVKAMLSFWIMMMPVIMVCELALAMVICSSSASATQFAIYMSAHNLGYSSGAKLFGMIAEQTEYVEIYMLLGALVLVTVLVLMFHRYGRDSEPDGRREQRPRFTIGAGGTGAVMFFSGTIRCPKCRADMRQIEIEDVEVDRCTRCGGIWFDAGEMELLRTREAAAAIDTGRASDGKRYNAIAEYRCPRCGGSMTQHVDPKQRHIWYETCVECGGSFFDAGEFRDLSSLTISDLFKRWTSRKPA